MKRIVILIDTPNIFRSFQRSHAYGVRPDYAGIYRLAERMGVVVEAAAFVNDGVDPRFVRALRQRGYEVVFPHSPDVDEALVARAVEAHRRADCMLLCSGDGDYCSLVELLRAANVEVVIAAVPESLSQRLESLSSNSLSMPVLEAGAARAAKSNCNYTQEV